MEQNTTKNPWLGLQSYREGEILYGRDEDIRDLTQSVLNDTDTLLYGKSGIGKSSILNAGVIPAMKRNDYIPVMVRLSHKKSHNYLKQVQYAIEETLLPIPHNEDGTPIELTKEEKRIRKEQLSQLIVEVVPCQNVEKESFYEYFHRHEFYDKDKNRIKLLVIFDQFEEIFTLQEEDKIRRSFFSEIADLLNDVLPTYLQKETTIATKKQNVIDLSNESDFDSLFSSLGFEKEEDVQEYVTDNDIHFIFTIREDFLSDFEYYSASIPSLKHNRYGLRPINEEQATQIIQRPIPDLVNKDVTELIIQKVTGRKDFSLDGIPEIDVDSAVLSLYLNRLYEASEGQPFTSELVEEKGEEIINSFYLDSIKDISEESIEYIEDMLLNGNGRRDNITIFDAKDEGGLTDEELKLLCDDRKVLRQFNYAGELRIELVHDILCPIVKAHKEQRKQERVKEEEKKRIEEETRKLQEEAEKKQRELGEKVARERAEAERKQKELEEKAAREKLEAELRQKALEERAAREKLEAEIKQKEIEDKAKQERAALEAEAKRIKARNKRRIISIGVATFGLLLLFGIGWFVSWDRNERIFNDYYKDFENIKGWPKGVGNQLSLDECKSTPLYYKLSYKGRKNKGHYTDVEIMSSNVNLPNDCRIASIEWANPELDDEKAQKLNEILSKVERLHYSAIEGDTTIAREDYIGKDCTLLMTVSYFHTSKNDAIAQYLTPEGENMKIRSNNIDRVKLNWDDLGRVISMSYYDNQGVQKYINENKRISGYLWDYSKTDTIVRYSLNEFGMPTSVIKDNTIMIISRNDSIIKLFGNSSRVYQKKMEETDCELGYSREVNYKDKLALFNTDKTQNAERSIKKDQCGNVISITTTGNANFGYPNETRYEYKDGLLVLVEYLDSNGNPYNMSNNNIYKLEYKYDSKGNVVEEKHYNYNNALTYHHEIIEKRIENGMMKIDIIEDITNKVKYVERIDSIIGNRVTSVFYTNNQIPINHKYAIDTDTLLTHKVTVTKDEKKNTKSWEFYVYNGVNVIEMPDSVDDRCVAVSYFKRIDEYDKVGNVISRCLMNPQGEIVKNMMYFYQGGKCIGRAARGLTGKAVRCDKWEEEGLLYYKLYYAKDYENVYTSFMAVDEWENRSSIFNGTSYLYSSRVPFKNLLVKAYKTPKDIEAERTFIVTPIFNSYNQTIFMNDPEMSDMYMPYIHVSSSKYSGFKKNKTLRDGDRIIQLGNWHLGQSLILLEQEWNKIFSNNLSTKITVLSCNGDRLEKNSYLYNGNGEDIGKIHYHIQKLTNVEKRIFETTK